MEVHRKLTRAFTLIELLVAVALLVLVIVGIGIVFSASSRTMRTLHVQLALDAEVRPVLRQWANDVARMDRDGFLVLRYAAGRTGDHAWNPRGHMSFLAHGQYSNASGGLDPQVNAAGAFPGDVTSPAAFIHWGLQLTPDDFGADGLTPGDGLFNGGSDINQSTPVRLGDEPLGQGAARSFSEVGAPGTLGRRVFALVPKDNGDTSTAYYVTSASGGKVPAHPDLAASSTNIMLNTSATSSATPTRYPEPPAHVTAGRTSAAALTPGQVMARIKYMKYQPVSVAPYFNRTGNDRIIGQNGTGYPIDFGISYDWPDVYFNNNAPRVVIDPQPGCDWIPWRPQYDGADYWYEAREFCRRSKVLRYFTEGKNAYSTVINGKTVFQQDLVNGMYRMQAAALRDVVRVIIDWTDGSVDASGNLVWLGAPSYPYAGIAAVLSLDNAKGAPQWPPLDYCINVTWAQWRSPAYGTSYDGMFPTLTDAAGTARWTTGIYWWMPFNSWTYPPQSCVQHDLYNAIFSFDNKKNWPKAIRVRMQVQQRWTEAPGVSYSAKPTRWYTQVMWLPQ